MSTTFGSSHIKSYLDYSQDFFYFSLCLLNSKQKKQIFHIWYKHLIMIGISQIRFVTI